jgi:hypothetical protein
MFEMAAELRRSGVATPGILERLNVAYPTAKLTIPAIEQYLRRRGVKFEAPNIEKLIEPADGFAQPVRRSGPVHEHPKGWEPRVEIDGNTGRIYTEPTTNADPERDAILLGSDLNPKEWRIVGNLHFRKWQATFPVEENSSDCTCSPRQKVKHHERRWMYRYAVDLERIDPAREERFAALEAEIRSHVPTPIAPPTGDDALVVCIADPQMGKSDGDGSKGISRRFYATVDAVEERIRDLRTLGRPLGALYLFGMGDLIENCDGHYAQQAHRVDLDLTEQVNVMRRLLLYAIERWAPLFSRVVIAAVGGNHGENRRDGKSFTTFGDNHDVAIFHQIHDVLRANPATYGHVSFLLPKDDLTLTLDVGGVIVGISHGHVAGKGGGQPQKKLIDWWMKQAHGQQPVGDARLLITAHYHHLLVTESGSKTHIQCPALEGGSDWWRNQSGQDARKGVLTLRIGKDVSPAGWADLEVL